MTAAGSDVEVYPVNFPVVALVASSGGLSVLIRILSLLPPDIPASLLVRCTSNRGRSATPG
ncbi:MAG: hypothetical protein QOE03_577 [Micromonosporaceae bacterium]|nr:hypothetical protein [Micromonosporaceae bacterium]